MSPATWPETLPRPTRAGYEAAVIDPRLRRSAETGPPGYRRRWSSVARDVALSIVVSRADKAVFDRFHAETTAWGTRPFWMPDPVTDGWPMLTSDGRPLLTAGGAPILLAARWLCLFGDSPPVEHIRGGLEFEIAFPVVVMP
jgi:hypothetical protein